MPRTARDILLSISRIFIISLVSEIGLKKYPRIRQDDRYWANKGDMRTRSVALVKSLCVHCPNNGPQFTLYLPIYQFTRLFLCILGLFLPPNFTLCQSGKFMLSCHQAGRDMAPVQIPNETKIFV